MSCRGRRMTTSMRAPSHGLSWRSVLTEMWPPPHRVVERRPWDRSEPGVSFLLLPRPARATLLVPTGPRRVTAASLRNYKSPSTRRGRWQARALALAGATGAARLASTVGHVSLHRGADSLVSHLSRVMGEDLSVGIHLGRARANQKPVLQLMRASGECVGFAKVGVNDLTRHRVAVESAALRTLGTVPLTRLSVPRILHQGTWNDLSYVVLSPVQTWTAEGVVAADRSAAMTELAGVLGRDRRPLAELTWWTGVRERLEVEGSTEEAAVLATAAAAVSDQWGSTRLAVGAAHGDWTPWNMSTPGGRAVVWDWERFSEGVPIGLDSLHYAVQAAVRLHGSSPLDAFRRVSATSAHLVQENGAPAEHARCLMLLYLIAIGERYLTDGQQEAGARRGALSTWLIPGVHEIAAAQGVHLG